MRSCQDWFASRIMPRMKLWSWQKENLPSIRHSVRTALAATASVIVARLVQMPEAYWAAIATLVVMQSSLGATLTLLHRTRSRYGPGRVGQRARGKLFRSKSCRLHAGDLFHRPTFVWLSAGEDRLSICQCHPDDHCFDSANKSCVDRCPTSIH